MSKIDVQDLFQPYRGDKYREGILIVLESHYLSINDSFEMLKHYITVEIERINSFIEKDMGNAIQIINRLFSDDWYEKRTEVLGRIKDQENLSMKSVIEGYNYARVFYIPLLIQLTNTYVENKEDIEKEFFKEKVENRIREIKREASNNKKSKTKPVNGKHLEIVENFAITNFFVRPALVSGGQILPTDMDNDMALESLVNQRNILKPKIIIIASNKAWNVLHQRKNRDKLEELKVDGTEILQFDYPRDIASYIQNCIKIHENLRDIN